MRPSILTDEFFDCLESSVLPLEDAETLPPECYTDRDFYELEKQALFNHEWLCVGRESDIPDALWTSRLSSSETRAGTLRRYLQCVSTEPCWLLRVKAISERFDAHIIIGHIHWMGTS